MYTGQKLKMVILGSKEELFPHLMDGMNSLRKDKSLYDVCIKVGDHQITAHKSVLVSVSDYFKSLFLGPFKTDEYIAEVDFSSVALDVESAEAVIDFLYTGTINIDEDNLEAILKLATFLLIRQLQDLCIKYIVQSCDLHSFMRYYLISVDYMNPEAEEIAARTVKSRFHDWFVFEESTKALSPYHLEKLHENYGIFEHCSQIDTLSFLVDWVLNGKTEEHEALACKIFDEDGEPQSDEELQSDSEPQNEVEPQNEDEPQSDSEPQGDEKPQNDDESQSYAEQQSDGAPNSDEESQNDNEEPQSAGEPQNDEEQEIDNDEEQRCQRLGFDIPEAAEKIERRLESTNCSSHFVEKCKEVIDFLNSLNTTNVQQNEAVATGGVTENFKQKIQDPDVEQVLIAVAPKQRLKDFLQTSNPIEEEIPGGPDDTIFDICVYVPRTMTWYYLEEGKNVGKFKELGQNDIKWSLNFCMLDKLCCASPDKPRLYMYPLNRSQRGGNWASVSYEDLIKDFPHYYDIYIYDAKFCCRDGQNLYLVLKKTIDEDTGTKVKFKCYRLSFQNSWEFVFETPYVYESEDPNIGKSNFDVHVSPGNKDMLLAVEGVKLHTFVADLQNRDSELKRHVLEGDEKWIEYLRWAQNNFWILGDGKHLSFVDEVYFDKHLYYRNMKADNSGDLAIDHTGYHLIDTRLPSDYERGTPLKLSHSVSDGTSVWLYLSDGKFETSLKEIRPTKYGFLDVNEHTPPPFTSVTLMVTGVVKSEHLADLKPVVNFLQD